MGNTADKASVLTASGCDDSRIIPVHDSHRAYVQLWGGGGFSIYACAKVSHNNVHS